MWMYKLMDLNLIRWWNNLNPLMKNELDLINTPALDDYSSCAFGVEETNRFYKSRLPVGNNLKYYNFSFAPCASDIIRDIFKYYASDETLVISSTCEHTTTIQEKSKCKNVLNLSWLEDIIPYNLSKIYSIKNTYKKVLVYISHVALSFGSQLSCQYLFDIKNILSDKGMNDCILVLDDVQGMFMTPCNYSGFDYIIGTAHAIVQPFNMGIILQRNDIHQFGVPMTINAIEYQNRLDILLKRKNKLNIFNSILTQFFMDIIGERYLLPKYQSLNFFALETTRFTCTKKTYDELLKDYNVMLDNSVMDNDNIKIINNPFIRFRAQMFICKPGLLPKSCLKVRELIDSQELINE